MLAASRDAGMRYEGHLEQDMIAVPIGPSTQRIATAAAPGYLTAHGRPEHPRDLLGHRCLRGRFPSGATAAFRLERVGEAVDVEPETPLIVGPGGGVDLAIEAAVAGCGIIQIFEGWL